MKKREYLISSELQQNNKDRMRVITKDRKTEKYAKVCVQNAFPWKRELRYYSRERREEGLHVHERKKDRF